MSEHPIELVCPAGTLVALKVAVDAGADTVYVGFQNETNARNFPGLNLSVEEMEEGIDYAHRKGSKVYIAINTFPRAGTPRKWTQAIDDTARLNADAAIIADIGLLNYAKNTHPNLRRHLSVQSSSSSASAINYYARAFDIKRIVLPRVLTIQEIAQLNQQISIETEVFAFGGLCVMAEGRCSLSSYITGESPNTCGVCSPANHVRYEHDETDLISKLNGFTINVFKEGESAGYPTLCKGRFITHNNISYLFEEPTSLNVINNIKDLINAGVSALKIEGRQRGKAYIENVVKAFREAIDKDSTKDGGSGAASLRPLSEGQQNTMGAYQKKWQ